MAFKVKKLDGSPSFIVAAAFDHFANTPKWKNDFKTFESKKSLVITFNDDALESVWWHILALT